MKREKVTDLISNDSKFQDAAAPVGSVPCYKPTRPNGLALRENVFGDELSLTLEDHHFLPAVSAYSCRSPHCGEIQ